jgi:hypothetical protein
MNYPRSAASTFDDLTIVLISRAGNRFLVDGSTVSVSFYIATDEFTEFYFLNPDRPGAPFTMVTLKKYVIVDMIKNQSNKWYTGHHHISVPKFYW